MNAVIRRKLHDGFVSKVGAGVKGSPQWKFEIGWDERSEPFMTVNQIAAGLMTDKRQNRVERHKRLVEMRKTLASYQERREAARDAVRQVQAREPQLKPGANAKARIDYERDLQSWQSAVERVKYEASGATIPADNLERQIENLEREMNGGLYGQLMYEWGILQDGRAAIEQRERVLAPVIAVLEADLEHGKVVQPLFSGRLKPNNPTRPGREWTGDAVKWLQTYEGRRDPGWLEKMVESGGNVVRQVFRRLAA